MQAILDFITQFLDKLKPWLIVQPWELGIHVRLGKRVKSLPPGIHFVIPFVDFAETRDVKPQIINLPNQSVTTKDGKVLAASGCIYYSVVDIQKFWCNVQDVDSSLVNLAMGCIADFIANNSLADCTLKALERKTLIVMRREAEEWGLYVKDVYITDLCQHRAYRFMTQDSVTAAMYRS